MPTTSTPATAMRYRDVAVAADWLCSAFGFEKQTTLSDENGAPLYVQLIFGRAMLMLAPVRPSPIDQYMKQPDEIGGAETQSGYYVVTDADAHYAQAKAAGASIILEVEDDDFGGRTYTCRDPEGHIWTFGTYDPWQGKFPEPAAVSAAPPTSSLTRRFIRAVLTLALMGGVGVAGWYGGALTKSSAVSLTASPPSLERRAALEAAEQAARKALIELDSERAARAAADQAGELAQQRAAEEQQAREAADRAVKEARAELERERAAKAAAPAAGTDLVKRVEDEARGREAAERTVKEVRAELEKVRADKAVAAATSADGIKRLDEERRAREAAERALKEARAEIDRAAKQAVSAGGGDIAKRIEEETRAREVAERAVKEVRAELEKARADKAAAEMAKEFALGRAEEEKVAREAADKAAKDARVQLERKGPPANVLKGTPEMQRALEDARKRAAEAHSAREEIEHTLKDVREQLAKEQASNTKAWKVVGQLTKQLKVVKGGPSEAGEAGADDDDSAPAKKPRPRPKKKADE